jgi:putative hemolysin
LLVAFFAGTETSFLAANPVKIEVWVHQRLRGARQALRFLEKPEQFLITTLIGTNIAMVIASSLIAYILEPYFKGAAITAVSAILLLTFGEIIPKSISTDQATFWAIHASISLKIMYYMLYPFIFIVRKVSGLMMKIMHINQDQSRQVFSRQDMEHLVQEGGKAGIFAKEEQDLISRFILRGDYTLHDVMVPRTEIIAVHKKDSVREIKKAFTRSGYSRLPVMDQNIDDVVGMITAKDIILKNPSRISQILRKIKFVPESRKIVSFLEEIQNRPMDMAIVVDEYGGTAGLITLEDIVEEFFGDIQDEYDEDTGLYRKITPTQIDVRARVEIHELNQQHQLEIPEGEYNTLAGFIMAKTGCIPRRGTKIDLPRCTLTVLSATRRSVKWMRIYRKGKEEAVNLRPNKKKA